MILVRSSSQDSCLLEPNLASLQSSKLSSVRWSSLSNLPRQRCWNQRNRMSQICWSMLNTDVATPKRCSTWVHFDVHCYCQGVPNGLTEHRIFTCLSSWLCQHCTPLKAVCTISQLVSCSLTCVRSEHTTMFGFHYFYSSEWTGFISHTTHKRSYPI